MQLDHTEIVIRQRSALQLLDLSLLVLRKYGLQIVVTAALLGLPLLVLDVLAVRWMLSEDALLAAEHLESPMNAMRWRHSFHLFLLFIMQFQIITLPTTVFLGNRIFYEEMPLKKLLRRLMPIAWRCFFVMGLLRLGLVGLMMEWFVDRTVAFDWYTELWLLFIVSSVGLMIRACWPFAAEILGLELCPLRSKSKIDITYAQRSRGLHKLLMADHMARFLGAAFFAILLTMMLLGGMLFAQGVSTGDWMWNRWFDHFLLPLSMWITGLYLAVFRFLGYLDSRIRLEGWEIELRLRAEADRYRQSTRPPTLGGKRISADGAYDDSVPGKNASTKATAR